MIYKTWTVDTNTIGIKCNKEDCDKLEIDGALLSGIEMNSAFSHHDKCDYILFMSRPKWKQVKAKYKKEAF